jgi:predicted Zn-dependent protease
VNAGVGEYNALVRQANSKIDIINQSADKEFEQGDYVSDSEGQRINVYEFEGKAKLVRLLAHEMGHALGIDHNDDPASIMYYLNQGKGMKLSSADLAALKKVCRVQ